MNKLRCGSSKENLICYKCKKIKPKAEFYKSVSVKTEHRGHKHGYCIPCSKEINASRKEYLADWHLQRTYGISLEEKREMLMTQEFKCPICGTELHEQSHLDHCHSTGIIRGVLCFRCNGVLGKLNDDTDLLKCMVECLEEYENDGN